MELSMRKKWTSFSGGKFGGKTSPGTAPSNLAIMGRYILTP